MMPVMQIRAAEQAEGQEKSYKVRGYASTFNEPYVLYEDYDGQKIFEQIHPNAFDDADTSDVIFQFDHAGMVYARSSNGRLTVGTDDHGLWVEADLGLTEESRKIWEAISVGLITRMSFCFTILDSEWDEKTKTDTITRIGKLYDVSAVSIPANPGTEISTARKRFLDGVIRERRAERLAAEERAKKIKILQLKAKAARARL
jgi:HK97 family phage prohead protease